MGELKPCPLCGNEASLSETAGSQASGSLIVWRAECDACGCTNGFWHGVKSEAVGDWNTRPLESVNADLLEALKKARNTLAGLGHPKIAANICDVAISRAEKSNG